jgi:hypothetical protein
MMVIEMREAAQERALDLVEELHELGHEKKMVLCELEDTLYDCFEDSKDEKEDEKSEEGTDLGFKSKYNRHYAMRNFNDEDEDTHHSYRRSTRMRRNRMGRFA